MKKERIIRACIKDIYQEKESCRRFRILWIAPDQREAYAFELGRDSGFPFPVSLAELAERVENGEIFFESTESVEIQFHTPEDIKKRDETWEMLGEALSTEPAIYQKAQRSQMLDRIAAKTGVSKNNLYRLLRRYWEEGKTKDCFYPRYSNAGARKSDGGKKRGNMPKLSKRGIALTDEDYKKFQKAIDKYYMKRDGLTLQHTYDLMLGDYYSIRIEGAEGGHAGSELLPESQLPSFWQFRYWHRKHIKAEEKIRARSGDREFELNHDDELLRADYGVRGPGSEFQIDATVADIYLVSPYNRNDIIGRPVVYLVVDVFSRLFTGLYVGLEGPSWTGMMMALYNTFTDKVSFCKDYGIDITKEEWPCSHLPDTLLGDRGELLSNKADGLVGSLGIQVDNTPPYMGLCKPFVERAFNTIDGNTTVFIPGRVKADTHKRGGKDYRLDAILTIREFTQVMIKAILFHNNQQVLGSLEIPEAMMKADADIGIHPRDIWNWGIANCGGMLRQAPERDVRLALMPRDKGSITRQGVHFKKLYYSCPEFLDMGLFVTAKEKGARNVEVSYDPRDVSRVFVWLDNDEPYLCETLDWEEKYRGMTFEEASFVITKWDMKRESGKRADEQGKKELKDFIEQVTENAKADASPTMVSKRAKLAGIDANKAQAKEEERRQEAFTGSKYENPVWDSVHQEQPAPIPADATQDQGQPGQASFSARAEATGEGMTPTMRRIMASVNKRQQEGGESHGDQ